MKKVKKPSATVPLNQDSVHSSDLPLVRPAVRAVKKAKAKSPYMAEAPPLPTKNLELFVSLRNEFGEITLPDTSKKQLAQIKRAQQKGMLKFAAKLAGVERKKQWANVRGMKYFNGDLLENLGRQPKTAIAELARQWPCFDWRWGGVVPAPRDQGGCGSCWAYTATAAFESRLMINLNRFKLIAPREPTLATQVCLSVQGILDCVANSDCAGGNPPLAFDHMLKCGARLLDYREDGLQFDDTKELMGKKGHCTEKESKGIRALAWGFVFADDPSLVPTDEVSILMLKEALLEHGPLAVFVRRTQKFKEYKAEAYPPLGVFTENDPGGVNHLVLLVGWDNARRAWIVLNSFGRDWGDACCDEAEIRKVFPTAATNNISHGAKGCMYIAWGTNKIGQLATWIEAPFEVPKRLVEELRGKGKRKKTRKVRSTPPPSSPAV